MVKKEDNDLAGKITAMVMILLLAGIIIVGIISGEITTTSQEKACKELGYESYHWKNNPSTCEDSEGNLHYVKMSCHGIFNVECIAKNIKVGDVTGVLK